MEDQRFAIVTAWVNDAYLPDVAFRLHRSVDAIDRAMHQLVDAGLGRVEHRRAGHQNLSDRYHLRTPTRRSPTTAPARAQARRCRAADLRPLLAAILRGTALRAFPRLGSAGADMVTACCRSTASPSMSIKQLQCSTGRGEPLRWLNDAPAKITRAVANVDVAVE